MRADPDDREVMALVGQVDLEDPVERHYFGRWKDEDGSVEGLRDLVLRAPAEAAPAPARNTRPKNDDATNVFRVLNLGAGVQSTTLYEMSRLDSEPESVPWFDCAVFADTGDEPVAVYRHLDWLKSLGGPPVLVVNVGCGTVPDDVFAAYVADLDRGRKEARAGMQRALAERGLPPFLALGEMLLQNRNATGARFASIPAYTTEVEGVEKGITRRQCTKEFKTAVIEKAVKRNVLGIGYRKHVPRDRFVHQYIGMSFDEPGRLITTKQRFAAVYWADCHFPLFDLEMTRHGCVSWLERLHPGRKIPRSACVFCPYRSNAEWRNVRDEPADCTAVEVDGRIRHHDSITNRGFNERLYLHRSCHPLASAAIDADAPRADTELFGFSRECEGMCGL